MKYQHLFFDLDRTLWDFETNSLQALKEIYLNFSLQDRGINSFHDFLAKYKFHNEKLWSLYREGQITKAKLRYQRFQFTLQEFEINEDKLAVQLGEMYVSLSPKKTNLFPFAHESLAYLKKKYQLHIITNGFEEVQYIKLDKSNLDQYFDVIVTSEQVGCTKPNPIIFNYALDKANAKPQDSIMIGDDLQVDLLGAKVLGIDQVFFNPHEVKHNQDLNYEIKCLSELQKIF